MFPDHGSRSASLFKRAQASLPGGNSRHSIAFPPYPIYAASGSGCEITDADGAVYIDCINNMSANIHGHRHPAVMDAAFRQQERLVSVGLPTETEIVLAEMLAERVASVDTVRFCNSGTEALMFAARAARAFTGRDLIAKIEGGYHGAYDSLDLSNKPTPDVWGDDDAPATVMEGAGITQAIASQTLVLPVNRVDATRAIIRANADRLAAVFIDPLVSRMGFLPLTDAYLRMVREETARLGILLVFDEVFSFRLGRSGAQGKFAITPDLSTFGKIIGGGFPIGALGGRRDVMEVFNHLPSGKPKVPHSGTFFANPVSMAAGAAALELLDEAMFAHLDRIGDLLRKGLSEISVRLSVPGQVMGMGSLVAFMPHGEPYTDYRAFAKGAASAGGDAVKHFGGLINRGVLPVFPRGFILSTPMTEETIGRILEAVEASVNAARDAHVPA